MFDPTWPCWAPKVAKMTPRKPPKGVPKAIKNRSKNASKNYQNFQDFQGPQEAAQGPPQGGAGPNPDPPPGRSENGFGGLGGPETSIKQMVS